LGGMAMSPWPSPRYVRTSSFPAYGRPVDFPSQGTSKQRELKLIWLYHASQRH